MADRKVRWRVVLPVVQTMLAVALFFVGQWQAATLRAEDEIAAIARCPLDSTCLSLELIDPPIGYVPAAHQWMLAINAPVVLFLAPLALFIPERPLPFLPKAVAYPLLMIVMFAVLVAFWAWIGSRLDKGGRPTASPSRARLLLAMIMSIMVLIALTFAARMIWSEYWGHARLAHLGAFLWTFVGVKMVVSDLFRKWRARQAQQAGAS